ncbi:MAG: uncharacterized protein KVP18_002843 [Porospora cf. gigantea A]|uniref:uncharacterized protein n=1 Tax=Porospora cf. gigantea A TaxID=2853593 RepID=UPI00355A389A|nr:MAG: hypothetical protein KVP18_002843 [Porospora cf. gigantea A]
MGLLLSRPSSESPPYVSLRSLKTAFPQTTFAVVATDDDVTGNAEYLKLADLMVELPKGPSIQNFASVTRLVDVAGHSRCDALWPGWGHASENCELPLLLSREQPGITWIGPAAEAMRLLGDKIRSTIVAQSMGVPCIAWSGNDVTISGCAPSEDDVRRACIHCPAEAVTCADDVGYPCVMKASAGGGGRGIRKVLCRAQAAEAYLQVVAELPGSEIFCMRLMLNCKHVEVQVLADNFGHVIAVGTRDCSVQRRCQKIIEEGPAIAVPARTLAKLEQDAIRLCSAVGYTNAGTVEFLFDMASDCYYFLEVNSRLQVEHTVTEGAYSVNLTAAQVKVALGYRLVEIDDVNDMLIRKSAAAEKHSTPANSEAHAVPHVISARITSEDTTFRPTTGPVFEVNFSPMSDVWGYFSVKSQGRIQQHMDSQFGHVFSRGPTREVARQRLAEGLQGLVVQGAISYNRDVLLKILSSKAFKDNDVHTTWLEESFTPPTDPRDFRLPVAAALYKSHQAFRLSAENFTTKVSQGQLPPTLLLACAIGFQDGEERYRFQCYSVGPGLILLEINGTCSTFEFRSVGLDMCYCIRRLDSYERFEACIHAGSEGVIQVEVRSMTRCFTENVDPRKIVSPMDGNLVRWLIRDGDRGEKHQPFAEIEVMKMYVELPLQHSGKVRHMVLEGSIFPANALLGVLELDEDDIVAPLPLTREVLEESTPTVETPHDLVIESTRSRAHLMLLLGGYCDLPTEQLEAAVARFFAASTDLRLPFACLRELLQECGLHDQAVREIIDRGWKEFSTDGVELNEPLHGELLVSLTEKLDPLLDTVKDPMLTDRFYDILRHYGQHYSTTRSVVVDAVVEVLTAFLNGQLSLPHSDYVRCCLVLRSTKSPNELLDLARMSQQTSHRKRIVMCVLQRLASSEWRQLIPFLTAPLKDLSRLNDSDLHSVAVMAQQLLLTKQPRLPFQSTMTEIRLALSRLPLGSRSFLCLSPHHGTPASTIDRVQSTLKTAPVECLFELLCGESLPTALRACEAFVRRHYAG